jgi:hypothetical protein
MINNPLDTGEQFEEWDNTQNHAGMTKYEA